MGNPQERVHARYPVDLVVTMKWRRNVATLRVRDVSDGGLFVLAEEQPALRELVRLEFNLPGRAEPFTAHGMAVNNAEANDAEGRPPGVGIQFYAMDRETARVWGQYLDRVRRTQSPLPLVAPRPVASAPVVPRPVASAPVVPRPVASSARPSPLPVPPPRLPTAAPAPVVAPPEEQVDASLELDVGTMEDLYQFYARDVATGGMFILTDVELPVGARLTLFVRHPEADDCFDIEAVVSSVGVGPDGAGLEVDFLDLDDQRLGLLLDFIKPGLDEAQLFAGVYGEESAGHAQNDGGAAPQCVSQDAWHDPFAQGNDQGGLAKLFDPWPVAKGAQLWSRPPPADEFDMLFDALSAGNASSVRPSMGPPAAANDEVPDFLMAIPSWSKLENPLLDPSKPLSIELDPSEIVEIADEIFKPVSRLREEIPLPMMKMSRAR